MHTCLPRRIISRSNHPVWFVTMKPALCYCERNRLSRCLQASEILKPAKYLFKCTMQRDLATCRWYVGWFDGCSIGSFCNHKLVSVINAKDGPNAGFLSVRSAPLLAVSLTTYVGQCECKERTRRLDAHQNETLRFRGKIMQVTEEFSHDCMPLRGNGTQQRTKEGCYTVNYYDLGPTLKYHISIGHISDIQAYLAFRQTGNGVI